MAVMVFSAWVDKAVCWFGGRFVLRLSAQCELAASQCPGSLLRGLPQYLYFAAPETSVELAHGQTVLMAA